jgi:hypothetical protein
VKENIKEMGMNGPPLREVGRTPGKQQGINQCLFFLRGKCFLANREFL